MDETYGLNDNTIKQLIPALGTQLKFKKALRILRKYIQSFQFYFLLVILFSNAKTSQRPNNNFKELRQKPEAPLQLLHIIQQQTEQTKTLFETINSQVKYIFNNHLLFNIHFQTKQLEEFLAKILANKKSPRLNSFNQLSSTVQNQLLDLPSNTLKISLVSPNSPFSSIPSIDAVAPSILPFPTKTTIPSTTTPVATSVDGPKGSSGVSFPAVIHPSIDGIAIKPVLNDIYNFQNYGKYLVTIYDQNSENILVETLVNVVPEHEICMPKKFVLRDSVNNILVGATVQIKLRDQIVFSGKTDKTGTVIIPTTLPKNCYDVEINSGDSKYKPSVFRMIVYENRGGDVNTHFICRQLQSDQLEIVLKWGSVPRDLDSHVFVSDGRHVYFRAKCEGNVSLDCDVTNGDGPETIKITLERNLKYLYVVHRYSSDGELTTSGATVTFNNGEAINSTSPYQTAQIPVVNQPGANFWIVCQIDGTTRKIEMFENMFENHNHYATDDIPRKYLK
jgi:hypothetical protein